MDKIKGQLAGVAALLGVIAAIGGGFVKYGEIVTKLDALESQEHSTCLLYTSPSPRDGLLSRMPSSA